MAKKAGKKKKGGGSAEESTSHPMKDLLSKEMKIMHLTEKIKIFSRETEEAHKQYKDLEVEYKDYKKHQEDMTIFLNEKLDDQYNKIDQLEHQIVNLKLEKNHFSTDLETRFTEEATGLQEELAKANGKIHHLESELTSLLSFKNRKEELENKTAQLEKELAMVRKETQLQLVQLDRQHIRQKERMASEVKERIAETERVTWTKWQSMYDDNTMKAMQKNKDMTIELQYQSRAAEKLMAANKRLQEQCKEAQQEVRTYKNLQGEFGKTVQGYKQQIKKLQAQLNRYEHDSFIDVAQPDEEEVPDDNLTARERSKKKSLSASSAKGSTSGARGSGKAAVVNLSLSTTGQRSNNETGAPNAELASARQAAADAAAEIERLNGQVSKYRARARQALEESANAKRALAEHNANVDQLGSFLLTAMEDLRKRKQKLAKLPKTKKKLPRHTVTGDMIIPDIPYIQLPLQSREELVSEFIAHVRSLKLQVAATVGLQQQQQQQQQHGHPEAEMHSTSNVGKLPDIRGSSQGNISAPHGNSIGVQCNIDQGLDMSQSSFWGAGVSSTAGGQSAASGLLPRENLDSRAFITSAQPDPGHLTGQSSRSRRY